ncbi:Retrovirus-related Pol polyprotein from transposon RE1 [Cardamine amara subsp. amara]|uniref:Retrovirus-related Pol polyprotein from transposon RE1 n=1 Tax=Cardamine amara subsp. amara TaxID=228776 RepID=A0ABD1AN95_CARAN
MEPSLKLSQTKGLKVADAKQYRRLIGKLQYFTITRPDICYAVSKLAQFSKDPREPHLTAVHKVLRYLKGTIRQGLFYAAVDKFDLRGYCDSDFSGCSDSHQSTTGYAMFLSSLGNPRNMILYL